MSDFDVHEAAFADDLIVHMGEPEGVEIATTGAPKRLAAIVGRLRVERVPVSDGSFDREEDREICQVSIQCTPGEIGPDQRVKVLKFTTGDASTHEGQLFYVRSVDSSSGVWTTVQLWRERLSSIQRRGYEAAR